MADEVKPDTGATADTIKTAPSGAVSVSGGAQPSPTAPAAGGVAEPAATGKGAEAQTLLTAGEGDEPEVKVTTVFPEDWRQKLAGDNAEDLKTLNRYTSPDGVWKALKAMRSKMSAGELKAVSEFPAEGDDKAKAEWRKQNGIPDKPEGYEPKVDGLVFGDADKPMLDSFRTHAHGLNWTPSQFNDALSWYAKEQEQIQVRQQEADAAYRQSAEDKLRSEWGTEYRRNINAVKNLLASAPEGFADRLMGARLADGRLFGDDPASLGWLTSVAREVNPAATLVPPGTTDAGKSLETELTEIRRVSRETPDKLTPQMEARQIEIIAALGKMKSRAA